MLPRRWVLVLFPSVELNLTMDHFHWNPATFANTWCHISASNLLHVLLARERNLDLKSDGQPETLLGQLLGGLILKPILLLLLP